MNSRFPWLSTVGSFPAEPFLQLGVGARISLIRDVVARVRQRLMGGARRVEKNLGMNTDTSDGFSKEQGIERYIPRAPGMHPFPSECTAHLSQMNTNDR
jgi:hypothetical protein